MFEDGGHNRFSRIEFPINAILVVAKTHGGGEAGLGHADSFGVPYARGHTPTLITAFKRTFE